MSRTADNVNLTWSYKQSGRLVGFQSGIVRQKLTVTIADTPPAGDAELKVYRARKLRNELHPTVTMTFSIEANDAIRCTEVSVKGGDGYSTVGLAALNRIGDPIEVGIEGIKTWLNVPEGNEYIFVMPGQTGISNLVPGAKVIDVSKARRAASKRDRDSELMRVALTCLANPESPNKAVEMTFGLQKGTARNRRKEAIKRGFLPEGDLSPSQRQEAIDKLNGLEARSSADTKKLLKKIKGGMAND